MEKIVRQTMLYDFYGELLTERQKTIYEEVVFNDSSYAEVAKDNGISRQGVFDLIKRCDNALEAYEEKLHLVARFEEAGEKMRELQSMIADTKKCTENPEVLNQLEEIQRKSEEIFEEF